MFQVVVHDNNVLTYRENSKNKPLQIQAPPNFSPPNSKRKKPPIISPSKYKPGGTFGICPQIQNKPKQITHTDYSQFFFIYRRTIPHRILNYCGQQVSKCIVVYVVHSETMTFMYGTVFHFQLKFIAVVFEVEMFREIKLSRISS